MEPHNMFTKNTSGPLPANQYNQYNHRLLQPLGIPSFGVIPSIISTSTVNSAIKAINIYTENKQRIGLQVMGVELAIPRQY